MRWCWEMVKVDLLFTSNVILRVTWSRRAISFTNLQREILRFLWKHFLNNWEQSRNLESCFVNLHNMTQCRVFPFLSRCHCHGFSRRFSFRKGRINPCEHQPLPTHPKISPFIFYHRLPHTFLPSPGMLCVRKTRTPMKTRLIERRAKCEIMCGVIWIILIRWSSSCWKPKFNSFMNLFNLFSLNQKFNK